MRRRSVPSARRSSGIVVLVGALLFVCFLSLLVGAKSIPSGAVVDALLRPDAAVTDHLIVRGLRVPRTVIGVAVGSALGVAGALMQGLTRNPLADPGLLGVTAGASFAVVIAIWAFSLSGVNTLVWFAFGGAAVASVVVYALGSVGRGGATPVRLALAGAAMNALLFALTRAVTLLDEATLDQFRFWAVGSLAGRSSEIAVDLVPFMAAGMGLALLVSRRLNAMALGDEMARALGVGMASTRLLTGLAVTLLCGTAVAAAGPIAFIGLVVPHVVRAWFGPDQRWLIPAAGLAGPTMLLFCDVVGRVVARPGEVQVGVMTAAIGGPAFVFLVRRNRMAQL